jgi:L-serine deaminase
MAPRGGWHAHRLPGSHIVSLDKVIKTIRETGADMKVKYKVKYKETCRGGLAVNVIELLRRLAWTTNSSC